MPGTWKAAQKPSCGVLCASPRSTASPVADLVAATGMSHRWINYRLRTLADAGQTIQIKHGIWRVTNPGSDAARGTPLPGLGQVQSRVCDEADAVGAPDGFCPPGI